MSFAFVPSNLGRAVSSRACPPGTGSGAALVRLAPANPHPLALALALAVQDDLLHASVPGYLVIQVGYVGLYSLTCMGACFSPAAAPNISLRPFGPDFPGPMKPCSLCCDRVCVCVCWRRAWEHGLGPRQDELWGPGQLPCAAACCHRSRVEWYGKEWPIPTAALPCLGRGGKVSSWKVLEGWMTMTDHLGRYMHTTYIALPVAVRSRFQGRRSYYSI